MNLAVAAPHAIEIDQFFIDNGQDEASLHESRLYGAINDPAHNTVEGISGDTFFGQLLFAPATPLRSVFLYRNAPPLQLILGETRYFICYKGDHLRGYAITISSQQPLYEKSFAPGATPTAINILYNSAERRFSIFPVIKRPDNCSIQ